MLIVTFIHTRCFKAALGNLSRCHPQLFWVGKPMSLNSTKQPRVLQLGSVILKGTTRKQKSVIAAVEILFCSILLVQAEKDFLSVSIPFIISPLGQGLYVAHRW